jgi:arylsulfatase A-like enzyme
MIVRHVDIVPTVLDVLRISGSYSGPGVSILKRLGRTGGRDGVVSFSSADGRCVRRSALVGDRFKYIYTWAEPWDQLLLADASFFDGLCDIPACRSVPQEELYDLHQDPLEQTNLLLGDRDPPTLLALKASREAMREHLNLPVHYTLNVVVDDPSASAGEAPAGKPPHIDESVRESMRSLGYLE